MKAPLSCTALAVLFVLFGACAKKQDDTPPPTAATGYPPQGYPQGYPPGYAQPQPTYGGQGYPNQYPPQSGPYAQPAPAPGGQPLPAPGQPVPAPTAAGSAGTMAVPGPIAFQCQNDVPCGLHHCNLQYGKCAFPCQSAVDCISPNQCMAGLCVVPFATQQPH